MSIVIVDRDGSVAEKDQGLREIHKVGFEDGYKQALSDALVFLINRPSIDGAAIEFTDEFKERMRQ